jgi:hypothetical protein
MDSNTYGSMADSNGIPSLIQPSNNSTSNPSLENLAGTTNGSSDETYHLIQNPVTGGNGVSNGNGSCQPHVRKAISFEDALYQHVTGRHVRTRTLTLLAAITAVLLGTVFWIYNKDFSPSTSSWKDSDLIPYGPSKPTKNGTRAPFSKLHPVTDMGLYDYPRPETSIPARPMKEGLLNRKNYPTNAWYQSLLMPMDEPTDIHRAYAIPYVVDTVGPMPGLRLHPNHIDASSYVIQLYVINEYGLSVGAAIDATSSSSKHADSDSPPTHQYKVTHATPLGLTLSWVRFL